VEPLRIGVLDAARIAEAAIAAPARLTGTRLVAVAARDRTRAEAFAATHDVERVLDSYADVLADPERPSTTRSPTACTGRGTSPRWRRASTFSPRSPRPATLPRPGRCATPPPCRSDRDRRSTIFTTRSPAGCWTYGAACAGSPRQQSHPTIGTAATALGLNPPTLVTQINRLERDLGGQLLTRAERGQPMVLTPLGRKVIAAIRRHCSGKRHAAETDLE
jgi:hypothetical protein